MTTPFHLRFPAADIPLWAARYDAPYDDAVVPVAAAARARGRLTHDELLAFGRWKSARNVPRLRTNDRTYVEAVTAAALSTQMSAENACPHSGQLKVGRRKSRLRGYPPEVVG